MDFGSTCIHVHTNTLIIAQTQTHIYSILYALRKSTFGTLHSRTSHINALVAHTQLSIKCTRSLDMYRSHLHASLLMKHTHLSTQGSFVHAHTDTPALLHPLPFTHAHTLPLEHWMQHTRTHCQIDLVPWNAG